MFWGDLARTICVEWLLLLEETYWEARLKSFPIMFLQLKLAATPNQLHKLRASSISPPSASITLWNVYADFNYIVTWNVIKDLINLQSPAQRHCLIFINRFIVAGSLAPLFIINEKIHFARPWTALKQFFVVYEFLLAYLDAGRSLLLLP